MKPLRKIFKSASASSSDGGALPLPSQPTRKSSLLGWKKRRKSFKKNAVPLREDDDVERAFRQRQQEKWKSQEGTDGTADTAISSTNPAIHESDDEFATSNMYPPDRNSFARRQGSEQRNENDHGFAAFGSDNAVVYQDNPQQASFANFAAIPADVSSNTFRDPFFDSGFAQKEDSFWDQEETESLIEEQSNTFGFDPTTSDATSASSYEEITVEDEEESKRSEGSSEDDYEVASMSTWQNSNRTLPQVDAIASPTTMPGPLSPGGNDEEEEYEVASVTTWEHSKRSARNIPQSPQRVAEAAAKTAAAAAVPLSTMHEEETQQRRRNSSDSAFSYYEEEILPDEDDDYQRFLAQQNEGYQDFLASQHDKEEEEYFEEVTVEDTASFEVVTVEDEEDFHLPESSPLTNDVQTPIALALSPQAQQSLRVDQEVRESKRHLMEIEESKPSQRKEHTNTQDMKSTKSRSFRIAQELGVREEDVADLASVLDSPKDTDTLPPLIPFDSILSMHKQKQEGEQKKASASSVPLTSFFSKQQTDENTGAEIDLGRTTIISEITEPACFSGIAKKPPPSLQRGETISEKVEPSDKGTKGNDIANASSKKKSGTASGDKKPEDPKVESGKKKKNKGNVVRKEGSSKHLAKKTEAMPKKERSKRKPSSDSKSHKTMTKKKDSKEKSESHKVKKASKSKSDKRGLGDDDEMGKIRSSGSGRRKSGSSSDIMDMEGQQRENSYSSRLRENRPRVNQTGNQGKRRGHDDHVGGKDGDNTTSKRKQPSSEAKNGDRGKSSSSARVKRHNSDRQGKDSSRRTLSKPKSGKLKTGSRKIADHGSKEDSREDSRLCRPDAHEEKRVPKKESRPKKSRPESKSKKSSRGHKERGEHPNEISPSARKKIHYIPAHQNKNSPDKKLTNKNEVDSGKHSSSGKKASRGKREEKSSSRSSSRRLGTRKNPESAIVL